MHGLSIEAINYFFLNNPIVTFAVGISAVVATILYAQGFSAVIKKETQRRRMNHQINHLKGHYIVCGLGRVGQQVAHELASEKEPFVIIDRDESKTRIAKDHGWLYLQGDVALDEPLFTQAHLDSAKALIIAVGNDADAIFMAVSARALNSNIFIVSRASNIEAADKLSKIGVNRVALPYQIGGYHMANMALRPTVVDFLDMLVDQERNELEMEEYSINEDDFYDGKTLSEAGFIKESVGILAIRRKNGKSLINPNESVTLAGGDRLVILGPEKKLADLTKEIDSHQKHAPQSAHTQAATSVTDVKPSPFMNQE